MPIVNLKPNTPPNPAPEPIRSTPTDYKGITVDTRYQPAQDVIAYLEGSLWTVEYFAQVLARDTGVNGQSLGTSAVNQQYRQIRKMELKVTSALSQNQDTETKVMQITGTANVYPCLIPNEGDMFLADIGDGREGIFEVTSSERKSIFKETAHVIEYTLIEYSDAQNGRRADLLSKVVSKHVFLKDNMNYNQNPIIAEKEYDLIVELKKLYGEITRNYFKYFFSKEFQTLLVPGQKKRIYDHFLVTAVKGMFSVNDAPELQYIRILNMDDDYITNTNQFWDVLMNNDYRMLNYTANQYGLVSARSFKTAPYMEGIRYSGVELAVYPKGYVSDVDSERKTPKVFESDLLINVPPRTNLPPTTPRPMDEADTFDFDMVPPYKDALDGVIDGVQSPIPGFTDNLPTPHGLMSSDSEIAPLDVSQYSDILDGISEVVISAPDIHLVTDDDYYVLSRAFYLFNNGLQGPGMSKLEIMVCRMVRNMTIDNAELHRMALSYHYWGAVERFYYVPVLLMLIKYSLHF